MLSHIKSMFSQSLAQFGLSSSLQRYLLSKVTELSVDNNSAFRANFVQTTPLMIMQRKRFQTRKLTWNSKNALNKRCFKFSSSKKKLN